MLIPIIFIAALLLALSGALLDSGIRTAKAAQSQAVARYADVAMTGAIADFGGGLAAYVARHGPDGPWPEKPSVSGERSGCPADPVHCPFTYVVSAAITAASSPSDAAGSDTGGSDMAPNLQAATIDEQRVSAAVSVRIVAPNGTALGTRTRLLTYRVFATAPYAVVSGSRDRATIDGSASAAQGDSGGEAPVVADGGATEGFADTRIHVQLDCATVIPDVVPLRNDQQVAGNDGLPWGNAAQAAYEVPCATPAVAADAFRSEHWTNGDTDASGWTP